MAPFRSKNVNSWPEEGRAARLEIKGDGMKERKRARERGRRMGRRRVNG